MTGFFVGIDIGGTKTRGRLWKLPENIKKDFEVGPSNFCSVDFEEGFKNIRSLWEKIENYCPKDCKCLGIGIGAAGVSNAEAVTKYRLCIDKLKIGNIPVKIVSDAQTALIGAVGNDSGIILISGTGSVCFGINKEGHTHQAGGDGHLIGDDGSGYAIGRDILSAAVKELDGRGEKTKLTELVCEYGKFSGISDILRYIYSDGSSKTKVASFAPLLKSAYDNNDDTAYRIADRAVTGLMQQACSVINRLGMEEDTQLAFGGSILNNMAMISNEVKRRLEKEYGRIKIRQAKSDALDGALYLISKRDKKKEKVDDDTTVRIDNRSS